MKQTIKVNIFLVLVTVLAILFAIFAFRRSGSKTTETPDNNYEETIRVLNDTVKTLKQDIVKYRNEIERIDLERKTIQRELKLILEDNEKTDSELANGDWGSNIKFLTDFLSEKDSVGK